MERAEIIRIRLLNQRLSADYFKNAGEMVAHFGAVQAQDYPMALWAVGARMEDPVRSTIENLISTGEIIRTHILRPTWHLVHQKDVRWMMEFWAPNVMKATQYIDKKEGLTNGLFIKAWQVIERQFRLADDLSKQDIMLCLSEKQIPVSNLLATQIIIRAELSMLLCNGTLKGTYALFEKRVPPAGRISRSEALTKLAQLYFQSRGPATCRDFAWWGGLSMSDAKAGMANLGSMLRSFRFNDLEFYHIEYAKPVAENKTSALLPCFDEYTVGYTESRDVALPQNMDRKETGNGIFKPVVLLENELTGTWKKIPKKPSIEIQPFSGFTGVDEEKIRKGLEAFCAFGK